VCLKNTFTWKSTSFRYGWNSYLEGTTLFGALQSIGGTAGIRDIQWIVTDVNLMQEGYTDLARGILTVMPRSTLVTEFRDYFVSSSRYDPKKTATSASYFGSSASFATYSDIDPLPGRATAFVIHIPEFIDCFTIASYPLLP
jgi:hypothetical protein